MAATPLLHATVTGPDGAPPVLLVHGAGGSRESWSPRVRTLPGRRVAALDLPGHGRSPGPLLPGVEAYADAVASWWRSAVPGPALVAGHSMGGLVALSLAARHPDVVSGLALVCTGPRLRVARALLDGLASDPGFPAAVEWIVEAGSTAATSPAVRDGVRAGLRAAGRAVCLADFTACDAFAAPGILEAVSAPTVIVGGAEDRLTPPKLSLALEAGIRGARLRWVPGCGHWLPLDAPGPLADALHAASG